MTRLCDLKKGQYGKILSIEANYKLKRRLLELGLINGEVAKILSISPLKNSYLISIKNYTLALRKSILQSIFVEMVWIEL